MRSLGLFGTTVPRRYGGLGLRLSTHARIMEELARGWLSAAGVLNPHTLCTSLLTYAGDDFQCDELLPELASGRRRGAFSLTEPHAGSDVQAIRTRATRQADGSWQLVGHKRWITNGLGASVVMVLAVSDPDAVPPHRGMTCFMVEKAPWERGGEGDSVAVSEVIDKMGDRGVETTDLVLDGYRCASDRVLGGAAGVGQGFRQVMTAMEAGRVGAAAMCVGIAQRCLDLTLDYVGSRQAFGVSLGEHQGVQFRLADMATKIAAARLLVRQAAEAKDSGERADLPSGMAKLFATEAAREVADDAFRLHGANGYAKDFEIERLVRDVLSLTSAEGPSDIQRMIIGRALLREARTDAPHT